MKHVACQKFFVLGMEIRYREEMIIWEEFFICIYVLARGFCSGVWQGDLISKTNEDHKQIFY